MFNRARRLSSLSTTSFASNVPFAAIIQGRNQLVLEEFLALPLFVALILTELIILYHAEMFGMPAL